MSKTVHIFSKPLGYYSNTFNEALIGEHDTILLQQDACYDQAQFASKFSKNLYMLETCSLARGISPYDSTILLDDLSWVDLLVKSDKSITW
ncbi:hypothetical protein A7985_03120 [Pseudoalteromonas luteoviolacea]|uniref:tRNA 2-thiouridine-synthesizing protein n=1 Tax=Pseudoalteromonas luteoviolacea TaxID=43657 RepID=A0A1C0TUG5_9GAMM|nr:hypothetical protein [Pseudoalteromonas luteoviolacea]MBQ4812952.1 hypothetical protein [Pseudoalteromonas luteoviolacea]OCQ22965.1 hypothetical protein A7985_03120 [Pseudoalteromonas luteoviolacea]